MFTIEMDMEETLITLLDPEGKEEDVQFILYEDSTYVRQWCEETQRFSVIALTATQFNQLVHSFDLPEGTYMLQKKGWNSEW